MHAVSNALPCRFECRISESEMAELDRLSAQSGMTKSEFVRALIRTAPRIVDVDAVDGAVLGEPDDLAGKIDGLSRKLDSMQALVEGLDRIPEEHAAAPVEAVLPSRVRTFVFQEQ